MARVLRARRGLRDRDLRLAHVRMPVLEGYSGKSFQAQALTGPHLKDNACFWLPGSQAVFYMCVNKWVVSVFSCLVYVLLGAEDGHLSHGLSI